MSDAVKHSEGPFSIGREGIFNAEGEPLFVTGSDGVVWWQNEADAQLFAAAPDLLEALLEARRMMWEFGFSENDLAPIRAAIAKVEA